MSDFIATTPFQLVRRLATAGHGSPSAYLLIVATAATQAVEDDLAAEIEVQIGVRPRRLAAKELDSQALEDAFTSEAQSPILFISIDDHWAPRLIDWLDRNVVMVIGARVVLFLTNPRVGERILGAAPNLRNRLTDVLVVGPDPALGGFPV